MTNPIKLPTIPATASVTVVEHVVVHDITENGEEFQGSYR
jgi:hypothetical protein